LVRVARLRHMWLILPRDVQNITDMQNITGFAKYYHMGTRTIGLVVPRFQHV
jgi:hypothetical protein